MPERDRYFAIADSTRRAILNLLLEEGSRPAGIIAARFPGISRVAVSKHLRILRDAGLLVAEPRGREVWYRLEPEALARMHEEWFARFGPVLDASLAALKANVEGGQPSWTGELRESRCDPR